MQLLLTVTSQSQLTELALRFFLKSSDLGRKNLECSMAPVMLLLQMAPGLRYINAYFQFLRLKQWFRYIIIVLLQGLSRLKEGLLVTEVDLNMCRQVRDEWGFRMTQRLELYAESLKKAVQLDYKPQIIQ